MIDYKQIFIRFLKEKHMYQKWLDIVKKNSWKHNPTLLFKFTKPPLFIQNSICEPSYLDERERTDEYGKIFRDFTLIDFEWRVICYNLSKLYLKELSKYVNSSYFIYVDSSSPLRRKYDYLVKDKNATEYIFN